MTQPSALGALLALREPVLPTYARADLTIVRGEGCRVWDDAGRCVPRLRRGDRRRRPRPRASGGHRGRARAARSALARVEPLLDRADAAARRVSSPSGSAAAQAFFCNSGAEANEAALKVARKATGRSRIVALEGSFHGRTIGALSVTGQPAKWEGFGPLLPGVSFARPNDIESLEAAVAPGRRRSP